MATLAHRKASVATAAIPGPLHAIILSFPAALFVSGLVTDIVYLNTAEIMWTHFSAWLIAGADLFAGLALIWALVSLFFGSFKRHRRAGIVHVVLVAAMLVLGIVNSFQHAKDAWDSVGTFGLILSILCSLIALAVVALAHSSILVRETAA